MNPFPQAQDMKELTRTPSDTYSQLRTATLQLIYSAVTDNMDDNQTFVTTDAITFGSATAQQRQQIMAELQQQGFTVTLGTTSFQVTWQR